LYYLNSIIVVLLLLSSLHAGACSKRKFTIKSVEDIKAYELIDQLSDECSFSVIIKDPYAKKIMDEPIYSLNIKKRRLKDIFKILIDDRGLKARYNGDTLQISSLFTKTFQVDYVATSRVGSSSTDITLSGTNTAQTGANNGGANGSGSSSSTGMTIKSDDAFDFWNKIEEEIIALINTPMDEFKAPLPIINKNAGFITVTGTRQQVDRVGLYVSKIMKKLQRQVLIDVKILSVNLDNTKSTGIDWSQIYSLQDGALNYGVHRGSNVDGTFDIPTTVVPSDFITGKYLSFVGNININKIMNFLKTQGDVKSISNPKVLTLNNQPALISSGEQIYYKRTESTTTNNTSTTTSSNEIIESVFAGVLLDITPSISSRGEIILKINPSISSLKSDATADANGVRTIPPDLLKKQIASVVSLKDGQRVVLGGLIDSKEAINEKKVPLLGDIPIINPLFRSENKSKSTEELVIIITPHIVNRYNRNTDLENLGYSKGIFE
jgi:general secretion pathway protein D